MKTTYRYHNIWLWMALAGALVFSMSGFAAAAPPQAKPTKTPTTGQALSSPYDVIELVNNLRASRGLPAYQANGALMASAQAHSEYQASVHLITHYGANGSGAKDRAIAAGYGGGTTVYVSENIYGGTKASAQQAVLWWQGDDLHLNTMLNPNYTDAGVGVATDGNLVYYTLDVGYIAGSPGSGSTGSTLAPGTTAQASSHTIQTATPMPDGSIVHTVQWGETLWTIAAAYNVSLGELYRINGFTASTMLYVDQKVKILEAGSITATPAPSETPQPTPTRRPTRTPTAAVTKAPSPEATVQEAEDTISQAKQTSPPPTDLILWVIGTLVVGGMILMVVGTVLNRRG